MPAWPRRGWALPVAIGAAVIAVMVGVLLAIGTHHPATAPSGGLGGADWRLESIRLDGRLHETPGNVRAVIRFDGQGSIRGSNGCNYVVVPVTVTGSALRFGAGSSTTMACLGAGGDVENQFGTALDHVDHWIVAGGELLLSGSDGTAMTFRASAG
jgi:heat shock protein HslJ